MRRIFIGSSGEALVYAEAIRDLLRTQPNVDPLLWTQIFEPGSLTFEAIERSSRKIVGAVLLATPDDESVIRGANVKVPRTNVMIEFGYLTAILGRRNIALCRYDGVQLATDLKGFTYIGMGQYSGDPGAQIVPRGASESITSWAGSLVDLKEAAPHGYVVHGYTCRWNTSIHFRRWRTIDIKPPDFVDFEGFCDLFLSTRGTNGYGSIHGSLFVGLGSCYAQIDMAILVENAYCNNDGTLNFTSRMQARQVVELDGEPPQKDGFEDRIRVPRHGVWKLEPGPKKGRLTGSLLVGAGDYISDKAKGVLVRQDI